MSRNLQREQWVSELRGRVVHSWRHDPLALWIGLIMLTNAVIFAILIQNPVGWKLGVWLVFCVVSLAGAAAIEKARMARYSISAVLDDQDAVLCMAPDSSWDDRTETAIPVGDR